MENQMNQPQQIEADITQTTPLTTWSGGNVWMKGYILRVLPAEEGDNLIPFEVFFDPQTGKILDNTLPEELRAEYNTNDEESLSQPQDTTNGDNEITWNDDEDTNPSTAKSSTPYTAEDSWGGWDDQEESSEDNTSNDSGISWE